MEEYELIKKFIGPIDPIGESEEDNIRYENLKKTKLLVESLVADIEYVYRRGKDSPHFSVKRASEYAGKIIKSIDV
jgi:hypothetical protein